MTITTNVDVLVFWRGRMMIMVMMMMIIVICMMRLSSALSFQPTITSSPLIKISKPSQLPEGIAFSFSELTSLPIIQQRAACAIIGAAVADAAIRPFHWVYNLTALQEVVGQHEQVEFWPTNVSPFYSLPTGHRSCYNDLSLVTLRSLPNSLSIYDPLAFQKEMLEMFSEHSDYAISFKKRSEPYDPAKRGQQRQAVPGPWQQAAVTAYLTDLQAGHTPRGSPESLESDGFCSSIPVIARGSAWEMKLPSFLEQVSTASRQLSSHPVALSHSVAAAAIIRRLTLTGPNGLTLDSFVDAVGEASTAASSHQNAIAEGLSQVKVELDVVLRSLLKEDFSYAAEKLGRNCANPGSFLGGCLIALQCQAFQPAVRQLIRSG
eukprot:scaffold1091_cov164-Ochromonas_danica.AAC.24